MLFIRSMNYLSSSHAMTLTIRVVSSNLTHPTMTYIGTQVKYVLAPCLFINLALFHLTSESKIHNPSGFFCIVVVTIHLLQSFCTTAHC